MDRAVYQRYADAFNRRDYDTVYDFYSDGANIAFFGVSLNDRAAFKRFYTFLHAHVIETLTIVKYASSDELVALEGIIRVEATRDLTAAALEEQAIPTAFAIQKGAVLNMSQYIHYHLDPAGKITSVGCAIM